MPEPFPNDVFLSHNHADKPRVRRLEERLKAAGVRLDDSGIPKTRPSSFILQPSSFRNIPLLLGDCALPDTLRRYKVVDFREESEAAFGEVLATGQAEKGAMKRRFGLPHGARRASRRRRARQSNATNRTQSRTLATLRDTLLPKLLSGELSVAKLDKN